MGIDKVKHLSPRAEDLYVIHYPFHLDCFIRFVFVGIPFLFLDTKEGW
jgi:hypothetical protein